MQEQAKKYLDNAKKGWGGLGKKVKNLIIGGLLATLVVVGVVLVIYSTRPYTTLFTGLNQADMTSVVSYLSENGVTDYRISDDNTILVPPEQEAQLKADLLMQGYPDSGYGYSTYLDSVGGLTTESERNTLYFYALQDRLAAVIRSFDNISDATVNIAQGEDRSYVLDSEYIVEASAGVVVTMEGTNTLTDGQVDAISSLVRTSVQGLKIENISIADTMGNTYTSEGAASSELDGVQDISALKFQLEEQVNTSIRANIYQVLEPLFGVENIRVSVNSIVDVDRSVVDSTNYTLEDWAADGSTGGEGIIGRKIYDQQFLRPAPEGEGAVGTTPNADLNEYVEGEAQLDGTEEQVTNSGQDEFLVDEENVQVERLAGRVSDVMISVTINQDTMGTVGVDALYPHIARAAGIALDQQQTKINILVAPFQITEDGEVITTGQGEIIAGIPNWVLILVGLLIIAAIVVVIILRGRAKRRREDEEAAEQQRNIDMLYNHPAMGDPVMNAGQAADIMAMETERSMELRREIRKFVDENSEIAAQVIKTWMREEGEE